MKRLLFAACCALLASAGTSLGADLPRPAYKAPPLAPEYIAPLFTWSGFYVGINGGYAWGKADVSNSATSFTTDNQDGWLIGATAGYNYQMGQFVLGVEGDIDYALIKGNATNTVTCGARLVRGQEQLVRDRACPPWLCVGSLDAVRHRRRAPSPG